jgi:hypothetical protein
VRAPLLKPLLDAKHLNVLGDEQRDVLRLDVEVLEVLFSLDAVQVVGDRVLGRDLFLPLHVHVRDVGAGPQADELLRDALAGVGQLVDRLGEGPTSN